MATGKAKAQQHCLSTALHVVHYQRDGSLDVEAIYFVHATKVQEEGFLVEASFLGASGKAHADLQNVMQGSDHLLHLCGSSGGCRSLWPRKGITHVME